MSAPATLCHAPLLAAGRPCPYCGVPMTVRSGPAVKPTDATREHVFPRSQGGRLVIMACYRCNAEKADRSPYDWVEYLFSIGDLHRAEITIRSYMAAGSVFPKAESAEHVIALCCAFSSAAAASSSLPEAERTEAAYPSTGRQSDV